MIDEIILLRHGRTPYNLTHHLQGQVDVPLDIIGQWQVDQSALALAQQYYWAKVSNIRRHPEQLPQPSPGADRRSDISEYQNAPAGKRAMKVISSDLYRAVQTAHAFADILGLPVKLDSRLREQNFGTWDGKTEAEIRQIDSEAFDAWQTHRADPERLARQYGIESRTTLGQRGAETLTSFVLDAVEDPTPTTLMLVGHGGFITATLETLLGMETEKTPLGGISNAFWSKLTPVYTASSTVEWKLAAFNCGPDIAAVVDWDNGPEELRTADMPLTTPGI